MSLAASLIPLGDTRGTAARLTYICSSSQRPLQGGLMTDPKSKAPHSPAPATGDSKDPKDPKAAKKVESNPPFTTKWGITSPKFGSAGSGGLEDSPGPEAD